MGRTHVRPIEQPDEVTCGPSSLKVALDILGKRKSLRSLISLCNTTRQGTTTNKMIQAINTLELSALLIKKTTLRHIKSTLKYHPKKTRAALVFYLYDVDEKNRPHPESGHWAVVRSYSEEKKRIFLFDSYSGKRKSYTWSEFRRRWQDYELKRRSVKKRGRKFQFIRKKQPQFMIVLANNPYHLPNFKAAQQVAPLS